MLFIFCQFSRNELIYITKFKLIAAFSLSSDLNAFVCNARVLVDNLCLFFINTPLFTWCLVCWHIVYVNNCSFFLSFRSLLAHARNYIIFTNMKRIYT